MEDRIAGTLRGTIGSASLRGSLSDPAPLSGSLSIPLQSATIDYNTLVNKPQINGVELSGDKSSRDLYIVSENTTAGWNNNPTYLPKRGEICVYTDYTTLQDDMGNDIVYPGIKIGDGNSYLIDMPFVGADTRYMLLEMLRDHESNMTIHITQNEREFWNNKLNYDVSEEVLILTRN